VIDLHVHTTASDGRTPPEAIVGEALAAGIATLAVTDHDTMAGVAAAAAASEGTALAVVPGIEITAVHGARDVHVLGYFLDPAHPELGAFLADQRADRRRRVADMLAALERLGVRVDAASVTARAAAGAGRSIGRPAIAEALVAAGHARDIADAFDRYLAEDRPAFIPRVGAAPAEVVRLIGRAGGLASLAHPGKSQVDALLDELVDAGMPAIEVYHPDHDAPATAKYEAVAVRHGLIPTGGSDYHGGGSGRSSAFGRLGVPAEAFARLARAAARPAARRPMPRGHG